MTEDLAFTDEQVIKAAKALRRGAQLACQAMTTEFQFPGKRTFNANGAWALYHAKTGFGRAALCERELILDGKHKRAAYRLTPLGSAVKAYRNQL